LEVVEPGKDGVTINDILVHDRYDSDPTIQMLLAKMMPSALPMAVGVIRSVKSESFDRLMEEQINAQKNQSPIRCVDDMLNSGDVFEIN
jgi:2-oxoglutarate ferredoxin oxidoreductase subunit beta